MAPQPASTAAADTAAGSRARTADMVAYDLYLRGRNYARRIARQDLQFALQMFENAVALDPGFALAHAALANVCAQYHYYYDRQQQWIDRASEAVAGDHDARALPRGLHPLDHVRQFVADLAGCDGEPPQRPGDPPGQVDREHQREAETDQRERDQHQGRPLLGALRGGSGVGDLADQRRLGVGHHRDPRVGGADPLDGTALVRLAA